MSVKHHCLICGSLIFSGMYCSDCSREIMRVRTMDDESFEEWLSRNREARKTNNLAHVERTIVLDLFAE